MARCPSCASQRQMLVMVGRRLVSARTLTRYLQVLVVPCVDANTCMTTEFMSTCTWSLSGAATPCSKRIACACCCAGASPRSATAELGHLVAPAHTPTDDYSGPQWPKASDAGTDGLSSGGRGGGGAAPAPAARCRCMHICTVLQPAWHAVASAAKGRAFNMHVPLCLPGALSRAGRGGLPPTACQISSRVLSASSRSGLQMQREALPKTSARRRSRRVHERQWLSRRSSPVWPTQITPRASSSD